MANRLLGSARLVLAAVVLVVAFSYAWVDHDFAHAAFSVGCANVLLLLELLSRQDSP